MSSSIFTYMNDGAHPAAQAVLAYLKIALGEGIESSWNSEFMKYDAEIRIARWENCREQGYVVSMNDEKFRGGMQLNIAWFEHRNSDNICAIKWYQNTLNSVTLETAKFYGVYKDKWGTSYDVKWNEAHKMAEWIANELKNHWKVSDVQ